MNPATKIITAMSYLTLVGCGPFVPVVKLDEESAAHLRSEIRVFDPVELREIEYRRLGQIDATSCMNMLWDAPASKEDAIDQLRYKASSMGGNGLANLVCERREGTSFSKNCWNSVTCYALAINAGEPGEVEQQQPARSSGTGFVVSRGGYVITNQHVIDGCTSLELSLNRETRTALVHREDPINDVALLKLEGVNLRPLFFRANNRVRAGEAVVALGFPLSGLLSSEPHVTSGTITALAGIRDDSRFVQMSAPIQPGNSGGPLLDTSGNVVGMVVAKLDALNIARVTGDVPQNVNFALNATIIRNFLDANGIDYEHSATTETLNLPDIAQRAKPSIAYIECTR